MYTRIEICIPECIPKGIQNGICIQRKSPHNDLWRLFAVRTGAEHLFSFITKYIQLPVTSIYPTEI